MNRIKKIILKNATLSKCVKKIYYYFKQRRLYRASKKRIFAPRLKKKRIFYLGIPAHSNLGDLAQGICIRDWLQKHYVDYEVVEIETNALVNTNFSVLKYLKKDFKENDFVVFQSGYTTTDLGGYADEMHRAVMGILPNAKMLMLPQTIFFQDEGNKQRTSLMYNQMKNMLFLARDRISYGMAQEMFPNIEVRLYPDIVTTLIGHYEFNYERDGILFCCRNDTEKYYSDEEIARLMKQCATIERIERTDTTKTGSRSNIVRNAKEYIEKEINQYAHYKLIITDRYHGTILSLVAGTPLIILKTTDHKVTTGAEWFKGVYDEYVYVADNLEEAYEIAKEVLNKKLSHKLSTYFDQEYYDKLPTIFNDLMEIK